MGAETSVLSKKELTTRQQLAINHLIEEEYLYGSNFNHETILTTMLKNENLPLNDIILIGKNVARRLAITNDIGSSSDSSNDNNNDIDSDGRVERIKQAYKQHQCHLRSKFGPGICAAGPLTQLAYFLNMDLESLECVLVLSRIISSKPLETYAIFSMKIKSNTVKQTIMENLIYLQRLAFESSFFKSMQNFDAQSKDIDILYEGMQSLMKNENEISKEENEVDILTAQCLFAYNIPQEICQIICKMSRQYHILPTFVCESNLEMPQQVTKTALQKEMVKKQKDIKMILFLAEMKMGQENLNLEMMAKENENQTNQH